MWCHFPSATDLIASLCGCENLRHDFDEGRTIMKDLAAMSTTFEGLAFSECTWLQGKAPAKFNTFDNKADEVSLLSASFQDIISSATADFSVEFLLDATERDDGDAVRFILKACPDLVNAKGTTPRSPMKIVGMTPLGNAAFFGAYKAAAALVDGGAEVSVSIGDKPMGDHVPRAFMFSLLGVLTGLADVRGARKVVELLLLEGEDMYRDPADPSNGFQPWKMRKHIDEMEAKGYENSAFKGHPMLGSKRGFKEHVKLLREFLAILEDGVGEREQVLHKIRKFDEDGNGSLTRKELAAVLKELGDMAPGDVDALLSEVGGSDDATIDIEHFVELLWSKREPAEA